MVGLLATAAVFVIIAILTTILFGSYVLGPALALVAYIFAELIHPAEVYKLLNIDFATWTLLLAGVSTLFSYVILYELTGKEKCEHGSK